MQHLCVTLSIQCLSIRDVCYTTASDIFLFSFRILYISYCVLQVLLFIGQIYRWVEPCMLYFGEASRFLLNRVTTYTYKAIFIRFCAVLTDFKVKMCVHYFHILVCTVFIHNHFDNICKRVITTRRICWSWSFQLFSSDQWYWKFYYMYKVLIPFESYLITSCRWNHLVMRSLFQWSLLLNF